MGKGFHYKFDCTDSEGNRKKIELDASNDNIAKQLAELECSEGIKSLSFKEADKINLKLKLDDFNTLDYKNDNPKKEGMDSIVLNATSRVRIAQYGSGLGCSIRMSGLWTPGYGYPMYGPNGSDNEQYNGANKWCVLLRIIAGNDVITTIPWTVANNGVINIGYFGFPTAVIAFMNDDDFNDNAMEPVNPMTAHVRII